MRACAALFVFFSCAILAACGNAGSTPPSVAILGQPSPTPTPFNGRLYVEYASSVGVVPAAGFAVYTLPLSRQSTPSLVVPQPVGPLAFDPHGNIFTGVASTISEIKYPFTATSAEVPVIQPGSQTIPQFVSDVGFDGNGNLWAETTADFRDFVPPFNAKTVATTIVSGGGNTQVVFSPSGTVYAGNMALHFGATDNIQVYGYYPYTAPPKTIGSAQFGIPIGFYPDGTMLISSTGANVYVSIPGTIEPPGLEVVNSLSSKTTAPYIIPFTVTNQASLAHSGAVDQNGTTYVLDGKTNNAIDVFSFPVTAGAKPQFAIHCVPVAGTCMAPVGVYLGP